MLSIYSYIFGIYSVILLQVEESAAQNLSYVQGTVMNLEDVLIFLREYENEASNICFRVSSAQWDYSTNITEVNRRRMMEAQMVQSKFERHSWRRVISFAWSQISDPLIRRQMRILAFKGRAAISEAKLNQIQETIQDMKESYTKLNVCPFKKKTESECDLNEPDLSRIMASSRNYEEQLYVWQAWHDAIGPAVKANYEQYVELANAAAKLSGFQDAGHQERAVYEDPNFENHMENLWATVAPLYRQLHSYVRSKLVEYYGARRIRADGPLPAHLTGNMWAQNWKNIIDLILPYPGKRRLDVTAEMVRQGYDPAKIFQTSEEFFTSIGMKPMPPEFWKYSLIEKPTNRPVACKASAWDFCNSKDFRIKQCTEITMSDLLRTHHEMSHIQYYLQYAHQPLLFRDGANPGFHEAIADAVLLSVSTPRHMHRIGLQNNITDDPETTIDFLMEMALDKVAYLPFAYLVDQWRWGVFAGEQGSWNTLWWELRLRHQGIIPPVKRLPEHFDPAAKYHVVSDTSYIRYFVSLILQFQLHKAVCATINHVGPLHNCDIYRSREAGRLLGDLMAVGASKPWTEVLKIATQGQSSKLDARPLMEYFEPLTNWLKEQNKNEQSVGWVSLPEDIALSDPSWESSAVATVHSSLLTVMVACLARCIFFTTYG
nr:PREDICTED: angiotensin-converting enzyme-like [Bemisia tabaci]